MSPLPVVHKNPVLPCHHADELDVYRKRETESYVAEMDSYGQMQWTIKTAESADKKQGPLPKSQLLSKIPSMPVYTMSADRCGRVLATRGWPMDGHLDFLFEMQKLRHDVEHAPLADFLDLDQLLRCRNHYDKVPWAALIQTRDVWGIHCEILAFVCCCAVAAVDAATSC